MTALLPSTPLVQSRSSMWRWAALAVVIAVWLLRVPSLAQPMAADQSLYVYAGQRLAEGHAPYAAAWDQKPPGVHVVYAVLWSLWPHESVVAGADLIVAGVVAILLIVLGRRRFTEGIGLSAAAVFLFFGNPSLAQRLSGVHVRAQCETFIALAVVLALVLVAAERRKAWHLFGAGVLLGCAFWLKYNAATYAVVIAVGLAMWPRDGEPSWRSYLRDLLPVAVGGALTLGLPLAAMGAAGALHDLYLATITYNLVYSGETFGGQGPLSYLVTFPIERSRNDALWLLGGIGAIGAVLRWLRSPRDEAALCGLVVVTWLGAACLSILINGARGLPQYFVQAAPALALMTAVGLAPIFRLWRSRPLVPVVALILLGLAVLRPGESGHLPKLIENTRADWNALIGRTDRHTYLARFGGRAQDKFVAVEVDALAASIKSSTSPGDTIYVFGFSPGVFVKSERLSASRFHWSYPVVIEFAAGTPGYGSAGLLADLTRAMPAMVALQKQDYHGAGPDPLADPNSSVFFHSNKALDAWLTSAYSLERETPLFEVWKKR